MTRPRRSAVFGAGLLVVASVVAGVLASEVLYRTARRFVCIGAGEGGRLFSPRSWGWTHSPGESAWAYACLGRRFEWRTYVTVNSNGLRDREIPYAKPTGGRRVLLLGDSITEALQVPLERTFAKLVEASLQTHDAAIDVINGGHAGYGTDNALFFYREEGRRYAPDLVLQVFNFQNDILENSRRLYRQAYENADAQFPPKPSFELTADGTLESFPLPATTAAGNPARRWMTSHLFLVRALERIARGATPAQPAAKLVPPLNYQVYAPWTEDWSDAWRVTTRLIQELRAEVERSGAAFAVVLMPAREMVAPSTLANASLLFGLDPKAYDLDRPRRAMRNFLLAENIPFLDLLPEMQAKAVQGVPLFFGWDVHMTENGHAEIAPALTEFVERRLDELSSK